MSVEYSGEVISLLQDRADLQIAQVHLPRRGLEIPCIYYPSMRQRLTSLDQVIVNTSALDLQLGTGGYGFITAICSQRSQESAYPGHIIKLRYTPWQTPVKAVESAESEYHQLFLDTFDLQGKHILVGELHSMLPVLVSLLGQEKARKIVYIMDDQACLQAAFSQHLQTLKTWSNFKTITYGQALGGDVECVNLFTALEAAVKVLAADDIIITQGPGVVGTKTIRGFSGMQMVHWIHTIVTSGGKVICIPRIQFADQRARHYGISQHTMYPLLRHLLTRVYLPYPILPREKFREENSRIEQQVSLLKEKHLPVGILTELFADELQQALSFYGEEIKMMGKKFSDDPAYFYGIGAAYYFYKQLTNQ